MHTVAMSLLILSVSVMGPVVTLLSLPQADSGLVVVISPPWTGAAARDSAIARAGGQGLGPQVSPLATLARAPAPGFGDRIRAAGPFLVIDGAAVAALCGVNA